MQSKIWLKSDKKNYELFLEKNLYLQISLSIAAAKLNKGLVPDVEDLAIIEMAKDAVQFTLERLKDENLTVFKLYADLNELPLNEAINSFEKSRFSHLEAIWYPSYLNSSQQWLESVREAKSKIIKYLSV
ncbi:MAG: hypothetical protein O9294_11900 [Cytophagales bacterium]|jgi:hypothetical protein|nr:hypothetical protein [Cytophagales bacterium]